MAPAGARKGETMTKRLAIIIAALAFAAGASARQDKNAANVSGVWQMNVQGDHVIPIGMELKQDGTRVTGTILMPAHGAGRRREVSLAGELADHALTLSGAADDASADEAKLEIAATLEKDGTMTGTLSVGTHSVRWTAERLTRASEASK
jgi:hypothetical protein